MIFMGAHANAVCFKANRSQDVSATILMFLIFVSYQVINFFKLPPSHQLGNGVERIGFLFRIFCHFWDVVFIDSADFVRNLHAFIEISNGANELFGTFFAGILLGAYTCGNAARKAI